MPSQDDTSRKLNDIVDANQKDKNNKDRIALTQLNLLIESIQVAAMLQHQKMSELGHLKSSIVASEKNINHALTLLAAARSSLQKKAPSPVTDYLLISALTTVAQKLPDTAIHNIIEKLKNIDESTQSSHISEINQTNTKTSRIQRNLNALVSTLQPRLLSLNKTPRATSVNTNHIVIDFAADVSTYAEYGANVARRLGSNLLQIRPDQFSSQAQFSITSGMTLTLLGHCQKGCAYLSDNSNRVIHAEKIAAEIYKKMSQNNTPLNTNFTIDLIACQAASAKGSEPAFATRLVNALASYGINNVNVMASPTIMLATRDGSQANMSVAEDNQLTRGQQNSLINYFNNLISSPLNSLFTKNSQSGLKEAKLTFRAKSGKSN